MEKNEQMAPYKATHEPAAKLVWTTPVLTRLQVEEAESGINVSENGATGS